MNNKLVVAAIVLPMSLTSLLTKPASAEIAPNLEANQSSTLLAQRYDPYPQNDRRGDVYIREDLRNNRQEQFRQEQLRQEQFRREQLRREEAQRNRDYPRRVWIPGHYEPGFLGIGRKWVEGHWEERR